MFWSFFFEWRNLLTKSKICLFNLHFYWSFSHCVSSSFIWIPLVELGPRLTACFHHGRWGLTGRIQEKKKKNDIKEFNHLWIGLTDHGLDQNSSPISLMWRTARRLDASTQHTKWREGREGGGFPLQTTLLIWRNQETSRIMTEDSVGFWVLKCFLLGPLRWGSSPKWEIQRYRF